MANSAATILPVIAAIGFMKMPMIAAISRAAIKTVQASAALMLNKIGSSKTTMIMSMNVFISRPVRKSRTL